MEITEKVKKKLEDVTEDLAESVESLKEEVKQIKDRLGDMVGRKGNKTSVPVRKRDEVLSNPFRMLQLRTNQLFDDFHRSFGSWGLDRWSPFSEVPAIFESNWPRVDVSENDRELVVKAELPGVDEKDIEVSLDDDMLTIRGDKKIEQEDKGKDYYRAECFHGSFTRSIPLPVTIALDKVEASFKKQVLTVKLPKVEPGKQRGRKIAIKTT